VIYQRGAIDCKLAKHSRESVVGYWFTWYLVSGAQPPILAKPESERPDIPLEPAKTLSPPLFSGSLCIQHFHISKMYIEKTAFWLALNSIQETILFSQASQRTCLCIQSIKQKKLLPLIVMVKSDVGGY
jgi:hypothetical protein